jgi:Fic family protein
MDDEIIHVLSLADRAVGRLDASTDNLPNPEFFVYAYVIREATLSSQIEGTQATVDDVFEAQAEASTTKKSPDVDEIFNYVDAMNFGLGRLKKNELPLCLRLIREIHQRLLQGVRGENREPGQFRRDQNYIGPEGCSIETATFVPPPVNEMTKCMYYFEKFLHHQDRMPPLVKAALIHAQFETIHPFRDGNGRIGRLLITLFLCQQNILKQPLLYLSSYFKNNHRLYYDNLQAIRDMGDWEEWVKFFLTGIHSVAQAAAVTARNIIALHESDRKLIQLKLGGASHNALALLDKLYDQPLVSANKVSKLLGVSPATANTVIRKLVGLNILIETSKKKRNRTFRYQKYWDTMYADKP